MKRQSDLEFAEEIDAANHTERCKNSFVIASSIIDILVEEVGKDIDNKYYQSI